MKRLVVLAAVAGLGAGCAALGAGCAATRPVSSSPVAHQEADLAVAGWRMPFQCLDLSERIEASQARLYESAAGALSTNRTTDERRLRALEARADQLGCLMPGSPFNY